MNIIYKLFKYPMFAGIPFEKRDNFLNEIKYKIVSFEKGEIIGSQNEIVNGLHIMLEGSIKGETLSENGVLLIETIKSPSLLVPGFIFGENKRFPVDVIALEKCKIAIIPKEYLLKQFCQNTILLEGYLAFVSDRISFLSKRLSYFSIRTIKGKLAQYILDIQKDQRFTMDMNQKELADFFSVSRPSLARSLSEIIQADIIELKKKEGRILNLKALKSLILS